MSNHDLASLSWSRVCQTARRARRLKQGTADVPPRKRHLRQHVVAGLPDATISSVPGGP